MTSVCGFEVSREMDKALRAFGFGYDTLNAPYITYRTNSAEYVFLPPIFGKGFGVQAKLKRANGSSVTKFYEFALHDVESKEDVGKIVSETVQRAIQESEYLS